MSSKQTRVPERDVYALSNNKVGQWNEVINSMPGFMGVFSLEGILESVNDYPLKEAGLEREQCVGKGLNELVWWTNSPQIIAELYNAISIAVKGNSSRLKVPLRCKNGLSVCCDFNIMPICDHHGEVSQIMVCGFGDGDGTRVVENGSSGYPFRLLDAIIENIPNMIFLKEAGQLNFEYFNRAGEDLLGVKRAMLIGRNDYDFFPQEQADFFTAQDRKVLESSGVVDIPEEPIDTPKGKRYLHTKKIAIRDQDGNAQYLMGISEDITERKLAEEKLHYQAEIIDQIHDSVVSTDMTGIVTGWNKGAERLHGFSSEEMLGQHISILFPVDERDGLEERIIVPLQKCGDLEIEQNLLHKNGSVFVGHLSLSIFFGNENRPIGMIGFCLDITERKLLESELDSYRSLLESQVVERTAALASARDEAERANKAKSNFLSKMSHELRTPLNAILGFAQMLNLDSDDFNREQRESIDEIVQAGKHLLNLINEVLDLSKIESGKIEVSMEDVSVKKLMEQCMPLIRSDASQNQVSIKDNISDGNFIVRADFMRLKQVLLNLLSNAIKYNRQGGEVVLEAKAVSDSRAKFLINDTGRGLTDLEIKKLFTPFIRFHETTSIEGTGIGLVIVKEIVEAMGGAMGVESQIGEGSSFWVELDLSEPANIEVNE